MQILVSMSIILSLRKQLGFLVLFFDLNCADTSIPKFSNTLRLKCVNPSFKKYLQWECQDILAQKMMHEGMLQSKIYMNISNFSCINLFKLSRYSRYTYYSITTTLKSSALHGQLSISVSQVTVNLGKAWRERDINLFNCYQKKFKLA